MQHIWHRAHSNDLFLGCVCVCARRVEALANQLPWWDKWDSAAPASTWTAFMEQAGDGKEPPQTSSKESTSQKHEANKQRGKEG
jgi:hypothetical protein